MKESIIMTVADREPVLLMNTIRWLALDPLEDSEIVIINDGSAIDYSDFYKGFEGKIPLRWIDMDPYECFRMAPDPENPENQSYNNPAKAFNRALEEARGEHVVILSSDVICPPIVLDSARKYRGENVMYCPMVIDLGSSMEYCGPHRVFPMPWMLHMPRKAAIDAGGWDENYLLGLCYEDNDFIGRLALTVDGFVCDWSNVVWHQSHYQPAYNIDNVWIKAANDRNRMYTLDKWTGIPFAEPDLLTFAIKNERHETGNLMMTFEDIKEVKGKVMRETRSPFVAQEEVA